MRGGCTGKGTLEQTLTQAEGTASEKSLRQEQAGAGRGEWRQMKAGRRCSCSRTGVEGLADHSRDCCKDVWIRTSNSAKMLIIL